MVDTHCLQARTQLVQQPEITRAPSSAATGQPRRLLSITRLPPCSHVPQHLGDQVGPLEENTGPRRRIRCRSQLSRTNCSALASSAPRLSRYRDNPPRYRAGPTDRKTPGRWRRTDRSCRCADRPWPPSGSVSDPAPASDQPPSAAAWIRTSTTISHFGLTTAFLAWRSLFQRQAGAGQVTRWPRGGPGSAGEPDQ